LRIADFGLRIEQQKKQAEPAGRAWFPVLLFLLKSAIRNSKSAMEMVED